MEKKVYYNVYRVFHNKKELIATYTDPTSAHCAAQRYNSPSVYIIIEKTSQPKF